MIVQLAPRVPVGWYPRGMGDDSNSSSSSQSTAASIASIGGGALNIVGAATSNAPTSTKIETSVGAALLTAAPFAGPAAPFLAVAGLAADLLAVLGVGSGCGQSCVLSSKYADQANQILQQNLDTYMALPIPRDPQAQVAALRIFDAIWGDLQQACSNPALGTAGKRCITDRQAGACTWKQTAQGGASYPGLVPAAGACWNWFNGYRDAIANDPNVGSSSNLLSTFTGAGSSLGGLNLSALLIPAVLLAVIWWAS